GLAYDFIESTSAWVETVLIMPKDEWTGSMNANAYNYLAVLYFAQGDGPCATCGGSGKAAGDPYVDGDALPVPLVNRLKTGVTISAKKTMEGFPATDPFDFVLLESDAQGTEGKQIDAKQNGTDGTISFSNIAVDPGDQAPHYYLVKEIAGDNKTIEYDTKKILYKVTMGSSDDHQPGPKVERISESDTFENRYKGGSLAIEIKTKGYTRPAWAWWWQPPKFTVSVTLKNREGKPLANYNLGNAVFRSSAEQLAGIEGAGSDRAGSGLTTDSEGKATLEIEGGKTAVISNLPHGATYEVSQPADSMPKGYSQGSAEGATGTITGGQESKATLENNYEGEEQPQPSGEPEPNVTPTATTDVLPTPSPTPAPTAAPAPTNTPKPQPVPRTGDTSSPLVWLALIVLSLAGIGGLMILKPKKKK
ncbi:MAG: hypothetical protein J5841_05620, partial [Clostridia bacterium]|nr:hypothetical protein [Clostridia bacterium]